LPQIGVDTVVPSTYAVTTQVKWFSPPNSPTIRGSAVLTIMLSSIASIIAIMRPARTTRICGLTTASSASVMVRFSPPGMENLLAVR
jgi:hypothetical protein